MRMMGLKRATPWLLTSALVAAGAGGCHPCESAQIIRTMFASKAQFAQQIDDCTADSTTCIALCADVMRLDPRDILTCEITSPVYDPTLPRSRTLPSMRGVNVRVDYNSFLVCALEDGVAVDVGDPFCNDGFCGGGGVDDGGGIDDGGDPGDTGSTDSGRQIPAATAAIPAMAVRTAAATAVAMAAAATSRTSRRRPRSASRTRRAGD
jgi:hypothetical protein